MRYRVLYLQLRPSQSHHLDVRLLKGSRRDVVGVSGDPRIVHRVTTADGTPLCLVLRGPDYGQFEARLASVSAAADPTR